MHKITLITAAVLAFCLADWLIHPAAAQDVKYCKNYQTGEIIVVDAGMPCPYPTVEL